MVMRIVARLINLPEDRGVRVETAAHAALLVRSGDQVRAYQADCPHAGAPLEKGVVCDGRIICPWHKAAFCVDDGQVCEPPALVRLKQYPVIVENGVVSMGDDPLPVDGTELTQDPRRFLVIGAGAAGSAAVATLRREGFAGELLWIDREPDAAYDRTALSKFVLSGEMEAQDTPALLDDEVARCTRIHGEVSRLDHQAKRIEMADGGSIDYDAALLTTGGDAMTLDIPGTVLNNVFYLRTREDAARIVDAAPPNACAVLIGDSFIGLEAASALRKRGLTVQVVSRHEVPLAAQLSKPIGAALRQLHQDNGVIFHSGTEPVRLEGNAAVTTVVLKSGGRLAADLVLIGVGTEPASGYIQGVEKAEDHSLKVDAQLRVVPGLWAAGDMTTFPWQGRPTHIEHWRMAQQLGVLAARNMLGAEQAYADVPFFWTYHFGKTFEVLGQARQWNHLHVEGDLQQHDFIALLCHGDEVEAIIACERQRAMALLSQRMKQPLTRAQALTLIRSL